MEIYGDAICIIILSENTKAKRSQAKKIADKSENWF